MLFSLFIVNGQNHKVVKWINENAIKIEDASPDSELTIFEGNTPNKFANSKILDLEKLLITQKNFST